MTLAGLLAAGLSAGLIAATAPSGFTVSAPAEVHVDRWIPVEGTVRVATGERRPVRLEELAVGRWHVMERTKASRSGRYAFLPRSGPIPQVRTFRVVVPRADGLARRVSRPFDVRIFFDLPAHTWQHRGS